MSAQYSQLGGPWEQEPVCKRVSSRDAGEQDFSIQNFRIHLQDIGAQIQMGSCRYRICAHSSEHLYCILPCVVLQSSEWGQRILNLSLPRGSGRAAGQKDKPVRVPAQRDQFRKHKISFFGTVRNPKLPSKHKGAYGCDFEPQNWLCWGQQMQLAQGEQRVKMWPHSRYVCFCRNEQSHCEQLSVILTPILSLALWPVHMEQRVSMEERIHLCFLTCRCWGFN